MMSEPLSGNDTNSNGEDAGSQHYCSFAATGPQESFQAIYICRSCCRDDQEVLCVCGACADSCHADHEGLEYVGVGPSYCDCNELGEGCRLIHRSRERVAELSIRPGGLHMAAVTSVASDTADDDTYVRDVFTIQSLLEDESLGERLKRDCQELVKHSRETFWLDSTIGDSTALCGLEQLAWSVFQQHVKHYALAESPSTISGAEWWVQVKPVSVPSLGQSRLEGYTNGSEAVDLHFDKDEVLAESFGLGAFPTLSTVTYLTNSVSAPPTVIFPRCYSENDQKVMSNMLVSHPRLGKHLVFDGRLLHGAPSHYALRPANVAGNTAEQWRITFLVNLWIGHKPAGVDVLSPKIRDALTLLHATDSLEIPFVDASFDRCAVAETQVYSEDDLPESLRGQIELPFLGKGTTWEDDVYENAGATVVVTYPPPDHEDDTLLVSFGPGLESFLRELNYNDDTLFDGLAEGDLDGDAVI